MRSRPAVAADMAAILDIDMAAFGADRGQILTRLPAFAEQLRVLETEAGTAGYAAAWRNTTSTVIGPVVAANAAGAERLIADLAAQVRGPIRLDLDPDGPELPRWALAHGLEPVSLNAVMAYGDWSPRGNPDWLHAPISVALA